MPCKIISSVQEPIGEVLRDYSAWGTASAPWFRGEPHNVRTPLFPRLFRLKDGRRQEENKLLQYFRMKAPALGLPYVPPREYVDQWLFLAQHVGLPTRLPDCVKSACGAVVFTIVDGRRA